MPGRPAPAAGSARATPRWKRILLKVSGEAFGDGAGRGLDGPNLALLADEIVAAHRLGIEVAVVNGGGNILRGAEARLDGVTRATADTMGMLATVVNALALQDVIESKGVATRVLSAIEMRTVAEPYIRRRAMRHMEKGRIVILAGGSGHPYFSTDTTAALRGLEVGAEVLLKGTKVDGVYDKDPKRSGDAKRFERISFEEVYAKRLKVMDRTAITMCQENRLPIVVFDMGVTGNLVRLLGGEDVGTLVGFDAEG